MSRRLHFALFGLAIACYGAAPLPAQQPAVAPAQVALPVQLPPQFQLNAIEQAFLDQVLDTWEKESGKVAIFQCPFERWEYNAAWGPDPNIAFLKETGELSYQRPDKGSFQIKEVRKWQESPVPPGGQPPATKTGDWIVQPDAIGAHWVCDGTYVYEYRHRQKELRVTPIPKELQGKAIVDGPLPFLFGAEANKLKERYWMRIENQPNNQEIWLQALPKFQAQAADFSAVEVILDRNRFMPKAMQVYLPNKDRHVYMFDLASATVNGHLQRIMALFQAPRTPFGWKRIVEQVPVDPPQLPVLDHRQAAQPGELAR